MNIKRNSGCVFNLKSSTINIKIIILSLSKSGIKNLNSSHWFASNGKLHNYNYNMVEGSMFHIFIVYLLS